MNAPLDEFPTAFEKPLDSWLRALERVAPFQRGEGPTLSAHLAETASLNGTRPALLSADEELTYGALAARAQAYGRWAVEQGLEAGEAVCLLMPNRPEYVAIWLGISAVRGVAALLNTGLLGDALLHAIEAAAARHLIVDARLEDRLADIGHRLPPGLKVWTHGPGRHWPSIDGQLNGLAASHPGFAPDRHARLSDPALLIYTSGTTGLPKAAKVSHRRVMEWSCWFAGMLDARPQDRMYDCLPMYHSVGGVVAIGAMLVAGASVLIRDRFSAGRFWDDVVDGRCTMFQYIGELCRYLAAAPPHPRERAHSLRLICGNGLRKDVWTEFQRRFDVPRILEFYAATEGNVSLYNCEGKPGAIGRIPPFLRQRFPITIVRTQPETGEEHRAPDGLCVPCGVDEPGEALGRMAGPDQASARPFEGYTDDSATERKILRNVLAPGDAWFRTGDVMRRDQAGFFYFVHRLGDTFRWKGENVSTDEVAAVICRCGSVTEAVVYGVDVPGRDGRAGMAAVVPRGTLDLVALHRHLAAELPDYAQPLFLRVCDKLETTGTHKPVKAELVRAGFDPSRTDYPLYLNDHGAGRFVPLNSGLFGRIVSGQIRL